MFPTWNLQSLNISYLGRFSFPCFGSMSSSLSLFFFVSLEQLFSCFGFAASDAILIAIHPLLDHLAIS